MMMYKIWSGDRKVRKSVMAKNYQDLLEKGNKKLGIPSLGALVLEADGTEIDDDDSLGYIMQHGEVPVLLLLQNGEEWAPSQEQASLPSTPESSRAATPVTDVELGEPSASSCSDTPVRPIVSTSEATTPRHSSVSAGRLELPDLSPMTKMVLAGNDFEGAMRAVVRETSTHLYHKYDIRSSEGYQQVSQKLVQRYPILARDAGMRPWSYLSGKLSAAIRQMRLKANRKSLVLTRPEDSEAAPAPKRFRTDRVLKADIELSEEDWEAKLQELTIEWNGSRRPAAVKLLLANTRANNRHWIQTTAQLSMSKVLERIPPYQEGPYMIDDFHAIVGEIQTRLTENAEAFFQKVLATMPSPPQGTQCIKQVQVIQHLEKQVAIERGKGVKSKTAIRVVEVDSIDLDDRALGRLLKSKTEDPPSLAVVTTDEEFQLCYVVGDGTYINGKSDSVIGSLMVLLAVYYVMDLHYPAVYSQLLGFLQQHVLEEPFTQNKGTKFINYSAKLKTK